MNEVLPVTSAESRIGGTLHQTNVGAKGPRMQEQEWWQHAARYCAIGLPPVQIAEACGVHPNSIYALQRSPVFQERVCAIMVEQDRDVMDLARKAAVGAMLKVIDLSQNAKTESLQFAACESILDRHLGKAPAKLEVDSTVRSADPVAEREALRAEIAALEGQRP